MAVKLLSLCLLLALLFPIRAEKQTCLTFATNCNECIQSGPECAWCSDPHTKTRCHTLRGLQRAGCGKSYMYNPQGEVQIVRNDSSMEPADTQALLLQPQELSLRLRPGVSQSFPLTITMATDQPTTELTMDTSPVPAGVNITFSSIMKGNPLVIQMNVEATQCRSDSDDTNQNMTGPWSVHVTPKGFSQSVKLEISLVCQCDCMRNREENSSACSGRGALVCGRCHCYMPYIGQHCQVDLDSEDENLCRSRPNALVCSGKGHCIGGFCDCYRRENPKERYSGQFCECSNFNCPRMNNRICGGHGKCECDKCICDDDWTGDACSCSMGTASCMATNQQLCNNRGMCQCGVCQCDPPYSGSTCGSCPTCVNECQQHGECAECRAFGTGAKKDRCEKECGHLNVTMVETKDDMPEPGMTTVHCKMMSYDDCFFYYTFSHTPSGGQLAVVRTQECAPVLGK